MTWFGFESEFWSGLFGAAVGALLSGLISWRLQASAFNYNKQERDAESLETKRAIANTLLVKLMFIKTDFYGMREHVSKCILNGKKAGLEHPYQMIEPLAGLPASIDFAPEECAFLLSLDEPQLFNSTISLARIHHSTIDLFKTYSRLREHLRKQSPAKMTGRIGTTTYTDEQYAGVAPLIAELADLADGLEERLLQDYDDADLALNEFTEIMNREFGTKLQLEDKHIH